MNKKIIWGIVIVIVIFLVTVAVKSGKDDAAGLTFGLISGRSGDYAAVGESFYEGAVLAREEWNSAHPDMQIEMIAEDDGFDPKKGISAYRKLTSVDKVDGLINMTTISIDAVYDDVSKTGMPVALGFEQGIDARDDNVVQLWPGTVPAEAELGEYVRGLDFGKVVLIVDKTSSAFERFAEGFKAGYGKPVHEIRIAADGKDYKSTVLETISTDPEAVVIIARPTSGAFIVKELRAVDKKKRQIIFDANIQTGWSNYEKVLGDTNILNGSILYTVPTSYRSQFEKDYTERFGTAPAIGSETGYNTFMLLAMSYDRDKAKWVENMKNAEFDGADGPIRFDNVGVRIPELKIGVIANGKLPE